MPRPGPRPYDCVRRAWHSERHQPMRGSIIQQIFRLVYEAHSAATKKNKEWQEKLPIVVFKAEEIMYSKANSEADYMNLETLWDRVNDAINTIIRRDESTETGELLPPCVEAALNLGCVPVKASRSQRHSNPRSYLSPRMPEPVSAPPRVLGKTNREQCPPISPLHSGNQLNYARSTTAMNPLFPVSQPNNHITENVNIASSCSYPFRYENIPPSPGGDQLTAKLNAAQLSLGSVYPLYYGDQITESRLVSQVPDKTNSNNIFVGKPVISPVAELVQKGVFQNYLPYSSPNIPSKRVAREDIGNTPKKSFGMQCDLSLRVGGSLDPHINAGRNSAQETEEVGSSSSQDRSKFSDFLSQKNKEFCFFPGRSSNDPFQSHSINRFSEVEGQNLEVDILQHKAPFSDNAEDGHSYRQPGFSSNQFVG